MSATPTMEKHVDLQDDTPGALSHKPSMAPTFGSRQEPNAKPEIHLRTWLAVAAASLGYGATLYALVATASILRQVEATLPSTGGLSLFAVVPFTLTQACFGPPVSHLSDNSSRKWFILVFFVLAIIGSYVSSEASSMAMFIAGRVLSAQCCTVLPLLLTIPSEVLPHVYRPYAQASTSVGAGIGCILACFVPPAFMASFGDETGWRWSFRLEGIVLALVVALIFFTYNPPRRPGVADQTAVELINSTQWVSAFLLTLFLLPFTVAVTLGGAIYPWSSARIIAVLVIGLVGLVLLVLHSYFKSDTLLDHRLFAGGRNYPIALALIALEGAAFFLIINFSAAQSALVFGATGFGIGGRLFMVFLGLMSGGFIFGAYSGKTKDLKGPLVFGFVCATAGFIGYIFAYTPSTTNEKVTWFTAWLCGFGLAAPSATGLVLAQLATPSQLIGLSSAVFLMVRGVFGTLGTVIGTSIVTNKTGTELPGRVIPAIARLGLQPSPQTIGPILDFTTHFDTTGLAGFLIQNGIAPQNVGQAIGSLLGAQSEAFAVAYRYPYIAGVAFAAVGILLSLATSSVAGRMNWLVDAPAEPIHHAHKETEA